MGIRLFFACFLFPRSPHPTTCLLPLASCLLPLAPFCSLSILPSSRCCSVAVLIPGRWCPSDLEGVLEAPCSFRAGQGAENRGQMAEGEKSWRHGVFLFCWAPRGCERPRFLVLWARSVVRSARVLVRVPELGRILPMSFSAVHRQGRFLSWKAILRPPQRVRGRDRGARFLVSNARAASTRTSSRPPQVSPYRPCQPMFGHAARPNKAAGEP